MSKATQRTLALFKKEGCPCDMVERWVPMPKHPVGGFRKDFLGIGDIIKLEPDGIVLVQSTGQAFAEHDRTLLTSDMSLHWLKSGRCPSCGFQVSRLQLIGWRKLLKKRGGKQKIWVPRTKEYSHEDFS